MGCEIEELARDHGYEVTAIIDNENDWNSQFEQLRNADVAMEFSMPETAFRNITRCFDAGTAVVSGTTGWSDKFDEIKDSCIRGGHALFYASNFSPGMNIMFELNKKLAKLLGRYPGYNILIEEIHHAGKIDAPSGTAITLAKDIIHYHPVKKIWVNKPAKSPDQLEIISLRRNQVPGMHFVKYDSPADSLEIRHTAHSRQGFALGALMAAEWLAEKKGVFSMSDLLYDNE